MVHVLCCIAVLYFPLKPVSSTILEHLQAFAEARGIFMNLTNFLVSAHNLPLWALIVIYFLACKVHMHLFHRMKSDFIPFGILKVGHKTILTYRSLGH